MTPDQLSALTTAIETAIESGFRNAVAAGSLGTPPAGSPPAPPGVAPSPTPGSAPSPGGTTTATASAKVNITAQQGFFDSMTSIAKKGIDATAAGFNTLANQQSTGMIKAYDSLLENFGGQFREVSSEEFINRDFSDITNAGTKAIASSFRDFTGMLPDLLTHMDPDEASEIFEDFVSNLGQTNINLIKQLDEQTLREASKFSKAMNISADEVGQLVSARFAETGETSSDILTEITNQAMAVGEAAGVPFKEMAEGIKEVKLDMDTFTDMTVDGAARMTASLKQLGLSLGSFKGMMTPFRDFDTAATKMGDMSAMFGVQMDAMEMMYLANEDEEQFLHRMREQLLDQGLDVESMSKTRQRALADQLGMGVKEMKMFMSTGQMVTDQADLDAASQEASTKTQADAINALNDNMKVLARTTDEITQLITLMQEAFSAPGISSAMQNMGEAQSVITKTAASTENISGKVIGIQGAIADGMSSASEGLKNLAQQLIPAADEGLTSAIEFIDSKLSTGLVANQEVFGGPKERLEQFGKDVAPKSWPEWLHGLRDAIKYPSSPEAQAEIQEAFSQMFSSISDAFGESATLEFDGMFEQQLADLTASVTTEADIMVQNINEALYNIEASDMEANISVNVDTENIASETAAMVSEINSMLSDIESPVIKAEFQPVIDSPTATLAEDVSKSIEDATRQIVERFEKEPTTVEVNIDMDQIKNDIVNVIKEGLEKGFDNKATTFRLDIEGNKLADIIAHRITTSKGERFKLVT